jgi:hypothetical protein
MHDEMHVHQRFSLLGRVKFVKSMAGASAAIVFEVDAEISSLSLDPGLSLVTLYRMILA